MHPRFQFLLLLALSCTLSACTSGSSAILRTLQNVLPSKGNELPATLNPNVRFLRLVIDGRVGLIALGYIDEDERSNGHAIDVWYSSQKEVIRLSDGRVVGAVGLADEWRKVTIVGAPRWEDMARTDQAVTFKRTRDVMPGYRYGLEDTLHLQRIAAPNDSNLAAINARTLTWFEETMPAANNALPKARYAVDLRNAPAQVVYGEQCLTQTLCFGWQKWPVAQPQVAP